MRVVRIAVCAASMLLAAGFAVAAGVQSPGQWSDFGLDTWPMGRGWYGPGPMPRHNVAMTWGVPAPYRSMTNPLPKSRETIDRGARAYAANCVSCHGKTGQGDGEAGRQLSPPPGNLAWLSRMPMAQWDAFVFWTISEGGAPFGTAMPAFKDTLSKDDIWAVTAYIQAQLPESPK